MFKKKSQLTVSYLLFFFLLFVLFTTGCEKSTTGPGGEEFKLSQSATGGLVSGWQTIHAVNAAGEVSKTVSGDIPVTQSDMGGIYSNKQLKTQYEKIKTGMDEVLLASVTEGIQIDDSLIWFIDWTDPISGISVRKALYYNNTNGHARYYEAIYQFPQQVQLEYDSTEIRVDLNFTLEDTTDDKLLSLYKLSLFKPNFNVLKIEADVVVTDYGQANEVTGAILHNNVWYGTQNELDRLIQELEINPDESGHISERFEYRDNTFMEKLINFYDDYTGDFSETWRDGTTVSGTFDRLEDDNHGSFTREVNYPAGNDPVKLEQSAEVSLNPADSSSSATLNEKIHFANGGMDTSKLNIDEYYDNGLKKTHLEGWHSNGSHADLLVTEHPEYEEIDGNYTGPLGYYTLIHAILYSDGSGEMWLTIYESEQAYLNGEPPLATIYIHFNPDGTGEGKISEGNSQFNVKVKQNGEMVVTNSGGKSTVVNGF